MLEDRFIIGRNLLQTGQVEIDNAFIVWGIYRGGSKFCVITLDVNILVGFISLWPARK